MSTDTLPLYDAAFALASKLDGFKTVRKTPMWKVQPDELPRLGVYPGRVIGSAEGDAWAGNPRFDQRFTIGFSITVPLTNDELLFVDLANRREQILSALFTDPGFTKIAAILSFDARPTYTQDGETPIAEMQLEIVVHNRSEWPPVVTDDFKTMHVTERLSTQAGREHPTDIQYDIKQE